MERRMEHGSLAHTELLTRSTNVRADTELVKSHQWQATYLSLTLSGGMFALLQSHPIKLALIPVAVVSLVQAALIVAFQISFTKRLFEYRAGAKRVNDRLDKITHLHEKIDTFPPGRKCPSILIAIAFALIALAGVALTFCYSVPTLIQCICGRGT